MGVGTGLAGAGMLTGVINFTTQIRAGLLMGLWGMANMTGRAVGSVMGGGVVDLVSQVAGGRALTAYATVFALEVGMLAVANFLTVRFDLAQSRAKAEADQALNQALGATSS